MTDLAPLLQFAQAVAVPALAYIVKVLLDIREHLARLNGRVGGLEKWTDAHERRDEKRGDELRQEIRECPARTNPQPWDRTHERRVSLDAD